MFGGPFNFIKAENVKEQVGKINKSKIAFYRLCTISLTFLADLQHVFILFLSVEKGERLRILLPLQQAGFVVGQWEWVFWVEFLSMKQGTKEKFFLRKWLIGLARRHIRRYSFTVSYVFMKYCNVNLIS
jgi:hypothetical protein